MSNSREFFSHLTPDQISFRHQTVLDRHDFLPGDYPLVREVTISRKIGRPYTESYAQSLEKLHQTPRIGPDAYALINLLPLFPNHHKRDLQQLLHEAVELLKQGQSLALVRSLLSTLESRESELIRHNHSGDRSMGEQKAIASVTANAEEIRREALAYVAGEFFRGGYRGSLASPPLVREDQT